MANYLIIGASSGIGASCVENLSKNGNSLFLVARDAEKLNRVAEKSDATCYCFTYDLDDTSHIKEIFEFVKNHEVKLDGMIYSAGINADIPLKVCTPEILSKVFRINCIAFAEAGKFFFSKRYSNDYSKIVAISSSASISCEKGMGPYNASKAALNAIVKTMSKEYVRRGILVNAVLPAGVLTPMAVKKMETISEIQIDLDETISRIDNNPIEISENEAQPLGIITPGNIAEVVGYLVSARNRYMTGSLIPVSGGLYF